ncbi:recombination regulator RecX, partial [Burkholderia multivorans]|uniref:recombination regulator RecX n=1 Tax=Burkholderia multivorans TaxID=87883 RepID=UPI0035A240EC
CARCCLRHRRMRHRPRGACGADADCCAYRRLPRPMPSRRLRDRAGGAASGDAGDSSERKSSKPPRSLKGRALGYLSRREYSRAELARKLAPYAGEDESVEPVLDALEKDGWLSDARFAESLVHRRASRVGVARIVSELKRHAIGDALVDELNTQLRETEWARAQAVWRKKFGALPQTPAERAKQARFLAARGFSSATIVKLLKVGDDFPIDD